MPSPNAILAMLDAASIPWTTSRAALMDRFGVRPDPWFEREIVLLDTPEPLLAGLLRPIQIAVLPQYAPGLPPTCLVGFVRRSDDALDNLAMAATQLTARLGDGRPNDSANTRGWRWQRGGSTVELTCWPASLQRVGIENQAHDREPRLIAACHLAIWTGYRPLVTPEEQKALDGFEEIGRLAEVKVRTGDGIASEYDLEFVRAPGADAGRFAGRIGLSRGHLIFGRNQLYVVAVERLRRFELLHLMPARGPGGALLSVHCATGLPAWPEKRLEITTALGIDRAEALASRLAGATGKPLQRSAALDD